MVERIRVQEKKESNQYYIYILSFFFFRFSIPALIDNSVLERASPPVGLESKTLFSAVHLMMKKHWVLSYPKSAQRRF